MKPVYTVTSGLLKSGLHKEGGGLLTEVQINYRSTVERDVTKWSL